MSQASQFYYIGIDPGLQTAITSLRCSRAKIIEVISVHIPVEEVPNYFKGIPRKRVRVVALEKVHSMPGQGVASTFQFGYAYGLVKGIALHYGWPLLNPPPAVWKIQMGVSSDKETARQAAGRLVTYSSHWQNHNKAESALLAYFAASTLRAVL